MILAAGAVAVILLLLIDLTTGASEMPAGSVLGALAAGPFGGTTESFIIWDLRLPMSVTALFVGTALSVAGLEIQNITGNALASPSTLGISSAASFGAALSITLGFSVFGTLWVGTALSAFIWALAISAAIYWLGNRRGMNPATLILAGIVMNFFFMALQQFLQYQASPEVAQLINGWSFGNLERSTWTSAAAAGLTSVAAALFLAKRSWQMTVLTIGEERALSLGVNVRRLRIEAFVALSILVACAVGFIGTVSFVGLVAPHLAKMVLGEDQRYLLPGSILTGASLMLASSVAAKLLSGSSVLPVGIITSIIGVPFLLALLLRQTSGRLR